MMAKIKDRTEKDRIFGVLIFGRHLYDDWIFGQNMIGQWNDRSNFKYQPFVWPILRSILTKLTERDRAIYYLLNII